LWNYHWSKQEQAHGSDGCKQGANVHTLEQKRTSTDEILGQTAASQLKQPGTT
jgi:hypothetical protein